MNGKPQFDYHQQSLEYIQRKLNQIPKDVNHQILGQLGQLNNDDLDKAQTNTILEKSWASSSVRIEHQPPKLGVEGSNPSPPANLPIFSSFLAVLLLIWSMKFHFIFAPCTIFHFHFLSRFKFNVTLNSVTSETHSTMQSRAIFWSVLMSSLPERVRSFEP